MEYLTKTLIYGIITFEMPFEQTPPQRPAEGAGRERFTDPVSFANQWMARMRSTTQGPDQQIIPRVLARRRRSEPRLRSGLVDTGASRGLDPRVNRGDVRVNPPDTDGRGRNGVDRNSPRAQVRNMWDSLTPEQQAYVQDWVQPRWGSIIDMYNDAAQPILIRIWNTEVVPALRNRGMIRPGQNVVI